MNALYTLSVTEAAPVFRLLSRSRILVCFVNNAVDAGVPGSIRSLDRPMVIKLGQ